jgi:LuxR family maltose regulon positive regulatory protein
VDQLLATKLYIPPVRRELVSRQRLIKQLNTGLYHKLTLISAPAGFGKTTLVSEWLSAIQSNGREKEQAKPGVAWLSLDQGDNELERFLVYFVTALSQVDGGESMIGQEALGMLQSNQSPPAETTLTALINDVAASTGKIIFVLDDYHLIDAQPVHDALSYFIENMPSQIHLVIATREDPLLPISRLRVRDLLTELRAADLRFTSSEVVDFLNQMMGLNLSSEDVSALETRTEGWIAGLQLAAISLRGQVDPSRLIQTFSGSNRLVLDYLIEEVLERQPKPVQDFLLQTAILDRLSGDLCAAITHQNNAQEILEDLEHANLFIIPLDEERRWYRYHHLFADLLRQRVQQEYRQELPGIYQCAALWYEQNKNYVEAIEYYLEGGAFERAAETISLGRQIIFDQNKTAQSHNYRLILQWLDRIPDETLQHYPHLHLMYTYAAWELGLRDIAMLESHFQAAEEAYTTLTAEGKIKKDDLDYRSIPFLIHVYRSRSIIYSGDFMRAIEYAEKALTIDLSDQPIMLVEGYLVLHWACREAGYQVRALEAAEGLLSVAQPVGYHFGIMVGNHVIGFSYHLQGQLSRAIQFYSTVLEYAQSRDLMWMRPVAITHIKWSNLCYLRNELSQSEIHLHEAITLSEKYGYKVNSTYARLYLAQLKMAQGEQEAALEMIQEVEEAILDDRNSAYNIEINAIKSWIHARLGNREAASAWLQSFDRNLEKRIGYWRGVEAVQAALIMLVLDQVDEALVFLPRLEEAARASGSLPIEIEALVMLAVARERKGETSLALVNLQSAMRLAAPERILQPFMIDKPTIEKLSNQLKRNDNELNKFIQHLEKGFQRTPLKAPDQPLIEPLTERELEVLQLIAEGLINQEIGDKLYLSLNTIKAHTRNIYGKLGVNSRTQAAARARALGILSTA